ncbi:MAG: CRISPR-associated helicase Cas3' [Gammaproteobacteria bacterium]
MEFEDFFRRAYGNTIDNNFGPYDYQGKLAEQDWPDLLDIPTGLGKTAAVTLAWLWKRGWREGERALDADSDTPRRLVWCLPMRVLVEQTESNIRQWLENLGISGKVGENKVSVHLLMGGESNLKSWAERPWAERPEEDMILIGTQDMLLSRALMRGYGMSRYQWPIHFSLLHNDCLWVYDEVQLMGAGLATSAQLDAFRRGFPLAKKSRTLWVSATLNRDWLATVDMKPHLDSLASRGITDTDRKQAGERLAAVKSLHKANVTITKDTSNKQGLADYLDNLVNLVLQHHNETTQTLIIVNRVDRAQQLFRRLREQREDKSDLLIHSRFRAKERAAQTQHLRKESDEDRIIVATQAIEAGVDISSKTLITELAPWASMVQRFGRCNRYGEYNKDGASIYWVDIEEDADALPYTNESLSQARDKLESLASANAHDLPATDEARPLSAVIRRKDLLDLFNTDPDLSGFDVDISDYIRDTGTPGVQIFWRDFKDDPNSPELQGKPERNELCPVSISQARDFSKRKDVTLWYWDTLDRQWTKLTREPRPGMTLLASAAAGGYDENTGFDASLKKSAVPALASGNQQENDAYSEDWRSRQNKPVALADHLGHVAKHAETLCTNVGELDHKDSIVRAGRWHDLGKAHEVFNRTMHSCESAPQGFLAKSPCKGRHSRKFFRHELASMLAWLDQHDGEPDTNLIAYLILAHHGKVRMSLRAMPTEEADKGVKRFARGIWEGEVLPALDFDGEHSNETTLKLALMEMGQGEQGRSWTERSLRLLDEHGPFKLAWLETLVRLADWRASAAEQGEDNHE